jgi:hypothetical protein
MKPFVIILRRGKGMKERDGRSELDQKYHYEFPLYN